MRKRLKEYTDAWFNVVNKTGTKPENKEEIKAAVLFLVRYLTIRYIIITRAAQIMLGISLAASSRGIIKLKPASR